MEELLKYLPLIIPLLLIQFALMIFALLDLRRARKNSRPEVAVGTDHHLR